MVKPIQRALLRRNPNWPIPASGMFKHNTDQLHRNMVTRQLNKISMVPRPLGEEIHPGLRGISVIPFAAASATRTAGTLSGAIPPWNLRRCSSETSNES